MKKKITLIDSTLRDGSHAVRHQFASSQITEYAKRAEKAGVEVLMVGHGNGLGGSSLNLGLSLLSDSQMLRAAKKELTNTQLGAFLIPGLGTIKNDLDPAIGLGLDALMVASHCTEANITRQYIEYGVKKKLTVFGVLMMSHMISARDLLTQARIMEGYGARGVFLMDSAGAYLMHDVSEKVHTLVAGLKVPVGFHAHSNLGLGVANSIIAAQEGATLIDATAAGLGAGAGNCPIEVIAADLIKMGYSIRPELFSLIEMAEYTRKKLMLKPQEINTMTLSSGLAGVFSGFAPHVEKAAHHYNIGITELLMELGREGVVAGQEDLIIHYAQRLSKGKKI